MVKENERFLAFYSKAKLNLWLQIAILCRVVFMKRSQIGLQRVFQHDHSVIWQDFWIWKLQKLSHSRKVNVFWVFFAKWTEAETHLDAPKAVGEIPGTQFRNFGFNPFQEIGCESFVIFNHFVTFHRNAYHLGNTFAWNAKTNKV